MSALSRLLYLPASRRSYSSYFSSKSGGGRYFNSTKPPKSPVVPTKNSSKVEQSPEAQPEGIQSAATPPNGIAANSIGDSQASSSSASSPTASSSAAASKGSESPNKSTPQPNSLEDALTGLKHTNSQHVSISSKDFKMHQFFSLHRPLLLISQPASIFRSVPSNFPLFTTLQHEAEQSAQPHPKFGAESARDLFLDPDAEAARQLTRALTLSKAGATLSWEKTMKHLGIDVSKDADRINLREQFEKEWEDVLLDSTKRKRRKKMKKHKLKKRRRATRSERLRLK